MTMTMTMNISLFGHRRKKNESDIQYRATPTHSDIRTYNRKHLTEFLETKAKEEKDSVPDSVPDSLGWFIFIYQGSI